MHKKAFKLNYHRCAICDIAEYELLDVHRIKEGEEYSFQNCICLCCNCHRKHHSGLIKILNKRYSSNGYFLEYLDEEGKEMFKLL